MSKTIARFLGWALCAAAGILMLMLVSARNPAVDTWAFTAQASNGAQLLTVSGFIAALTILISLFFSVGLLCRGYDTED